MSKRSFTYDANGNMTMDGNNGIYSIAYNVLNLPKKVTFAEPGVYNEYVCSADGTKLSVLHKKASTEVRTDYVGNMIYKNDSILNMILVDGGYIKDGQYHFFLQDHLGSNRVVARADGTVVQTNHYYPYGTPFAESYAPDVQDRKYIGKEYDTDNGLDWYDVEARMMDGLRFTTMDPLADKYYSWSPYVYGFANPLRYLDPTGKEGIRYTDENGNKIIESNVVVLLEQKKSIPKDATEKQKAKIERKNQRIERRNNARIADVQQRLNDAYNGANGQGTKNSAGEMVKFVFNVKGIETSDTKGGSILQISKLAIANGLPTSAKDPIGNSRIATAAVVTTRSSRGALGLSNHVFVTEAPGAPPIALAHEIGHTLQLEDSFGKTFNEGLMYYPPGSLNASEVDEISELLTSRKLKLS